MLQVFVQRKFLPEKKYILDLLLNEFLQITYQLNYHEKASYKIVAETGSYLEVKDAFFSKFDEAEGYLHETNVPSSISYGKNSFLSEDNAIILFGDNEYTKTAHNIKLGNDIFAASFFMLTRWEENVIAERDLHNRFPDEKSIAQRFAFHKRPVVDEYLFMLEKMLHFLGEETFRNTEGYRLTLTHDIDDIERYASFYKTFRALTGDLIRRRSISLFLKTLFDILLVKMKRKKDPYDQFDFLMNLAEANGLNSYFYFIPGIKGEPDVRYDFSNSKVGERITSILNRGHQVGIHGSLRSNESLQYYLEERNRFQKTYKPIQHNRQHFLSFSVPDTWQILEEAGMSSDTTLGFANDWGFRAGTSLNYPVFDVIKRVRFKLREYPLIAMDTAIKRKYANLESMYWELKKAYSIVKRYNGNMVILWHNNNINHYEWKGTKEFLENIVKEIHQ